MSGCSRDLAALVGQTVETLVVEGEQNSVSRRVDIGLEVLVSQVDRPLERRHGVLGAVRGTTSVRERNRTVVVEKRVDPHMFSVPRARRARDGGAAET
jgi:hypothetical protein